MASLRKPTEMKRETVVQEIRQILGPEKNAPADSYRRVQLLVPDDPTVWAWITKNANENVAETVGLNRGTYKGPPLAAGNGIDFCILPNQTVWAAAKASTASLTIVIEYIKEA